MVEEKQSTNKILICPTDFNLCSLNERNDLIEMYLGLDVGAIEIII